MQFGAYNLDLSPRLKIQDLSLKLESNISHFWGSNGTGKTTVLGLIKADLQKSNQRYSYLDQNYRKNWFWWYSNLQNLKLAATQKYPKLEDSPVYQRHQTWLAPLIEENNRQVDFSKQDISESIGLSGGQLQKLILLRELLLEPKLLLLDEAFSAFDPETLDIVLEFLLSEQRELGFKIISISHQQNIVDKLGGSVYYFELNQDSVLGISNSQKIPG